MTARTGETVYQRMLSGQSLHPEAGGATMFSHSKITDWSGWPDDVRELIRGWNKDRRLHFVPAGRFWCLDCRRLIDSSGSTAAKLDGALVCDDCMIERARRFGDLGRKESDLEKAKRWQRNMQKKLVKYRHNAIQEREYVAELMARADVAASRAHDALWAKPFDRPTASAAIWEIHDLLRPYIEKATR